MVNSSYKAILFRSGWVFFGRLIVAGSMLSINVMLARMLSAEELGLYFLIFSLVSIAAIVSQCGLAQAVVRLIPAAIAVGSTARAKRITLLSLVILLAGVLVVATFGVFGGGVFLVEHLFHSIALSELIGLAFLWVGVLAFQSVMAEIFRGFHDIRLATLFGGVLTSIILVVGLFIWMVMNSNIELSQVLLLAVFSGGVSILFAVYFLQKQLQLLPKGGGWVSIGELLEVSWPLWITAMLLFVLTQADIWVLGIYKEPSEVALYGVAAKLALLIGLPLGIINAVIPPVISEMYAKGDNKQLENILRTITTFSGIPLVILLITLIFSSEFLLGVLFGEHYTQAAMVFSVLCIGQMVNVWTGSPGVLLIQAGQGKALMVITIISGLFSVVLALLLVELWGGMGVAVATALGIVIHNIIMLWRCKVALKINPSMFSLADFPRLYITLREKLDERVINSENKILLFILLMLRSIDGLVWRLSGKMVVDCYGDSHVSALLWLNQRLKKTRFIINSVRGATALGVTNPNSQTNAMNIFSSLLKRSPKRYELLFLLGEVDCGFLIWVLAERNKEPVDILLDRAIDSYKSFIEGYVLKNRKITVLSCPLPTIRDGEKSGEVAFLRNAVDACQHDRTELTIKFNKRIAEWCNERGVRFIDLDTASLNLQTGLVRKSLLNSDQTDHHYETSAYCDLLQNSKFYG